MSTSGSPSVLVMRPAASVHTVLISSSVRLTITAAGHDAGSSGSKCFACSSSESDAESTSTTTPVFGIATKHEYIVTLSSGLTHVRARNCTRCCCHLTMNGESSGV